jgi:Nitrogen regulatory protein P-II
MKMLTLVCGEKIEDEVLGLFNELEIKGYSVISGVEGRGQTGIVSGAGGWWIDRNKLYLVALDDDHMAPLVNAVREMYARLIQAHYGHEVPLKVFVQPCELIV